MIARNDTAPSVGARGAGRNVKAGSLDARKSTATGAAGASAPPRAQQSAEARATVSDWNRDLHARAATLRAEIRAQPRPDWLPDSDEIELALVLVRPRSHYAEKLGAREIDAGATAAVVAAMESGRRVIYVDPMSDDPVPEVVYRLVATADRPVLVARYSRSLHIERTVAKKLGWRELNPCRDDAEELERWQLQTAKGCRNWLQFYAQLERIEPAQAKERLQVLDEQRQEAEIERARAMDAALRNGSLTLTPGQYLALNRHRPRDLLPGLVMARAVAAVFAGPNQGKSLFAHAMTAHLAMGKSFAGRPAAAPGRVVYCALEATNQAAENIYAHATTDEERRLIDENVEMTSCLPSLGAVDAEGRRMASTSAMEAWAQKLATRKPVLIVIDTFTKALGREGATEWQGAPLLLDALRGVVAVTGAAVLILAHTRKGGTDERGQSLREDADCMFPLERLSANPSEVVVRLGLSDPVLAKVRSGAMSQHDLELTFRPVRGGMVLVGHQQLDGTTTPTPRKLDRDQEAVAAAIRKAAKPVTQAEICDATKLPQPRVSKALGKLRMVDVDRSRKPHTYRFREGGSGE